MVNIYDEPTTDSDEQLFEPAVILYGFMMANQFELDSDIWFILEWTKMEITWKILCYVTWRPREPYKENNFG